MSTTRKSIHHAFRMAVFWTRVEAGDYFITKPNFQIGWGGLTPQCREYILSGGHPHSRIFAAIPGGTINGPVIKVHVVQILGTHGLEVAVP